MADNDTTTKVDAQTPAQKEETEQTSAQKEGTKEETISKAEVTRMLKKQAAELTARYKPFEEKAKKLEEIEAAKLNDEEKASKRLKDLENKIAEKDRILAEKTLRDLKRSKIEQAIADGKMALPKGKTIDSLVNRATATREEDIDSDIEDLIGFFPVSAETKEAPKGLGTQTKTGEPVTKITNKDRLREVNNKMSNPKLPQRERTDLIAEAVKLNRLIQKGEM